MQWRPSTGKEAVYAKEVQIEEPVDDDFDEFVKFSGSALLQEPSHKVMPVRRTSV